MKKKSFLSILALAIVIALGTTAFTNQTNAKSLILDGICDYSVGVGDESFGTCVEDPTPEPECETSKNEGGVNGPNEDCPR